MFKDQKHYVQEPTKPYRGEAVASLKGAVAAVPSDYTKRKNVFRLKLANGAEYLFEAKNAVSHWSACATIPHVLLSVIRRRK